MTTQPDREAWVEHLADLFAKRRTHGQVFMGGEHHPTPSEVKDAREFVDALLAAGTPTEVAGICMGPSHTSCNHDEEGLPHPAPPPAEDTAASTLCSKDHVAGTRVGECDKCFMYLAGAADQARSMRQHGWTPPAEDTDTLRDHRLRRAMLALADMWSVRTPTERNCATQLVEVLAAFRPSPHPSVKTLP